MFPIYTSTNPDDIAKGRLWRITSRKTGKIRFLHGTIHTNSTLLLAGSPELYAILKRAPKILFERPDFTTYAAQAVHVLDAVLVLPKAVELEPRIASLVAKNAKLYKQFLEATHKNIIEFYSANYKRQIDPSRLKKLDCFALMGLVDFILTCKATNFVFSQYDHKLLQFCKAIKPESVALIEEIPQLIQADRDTALHLNDQQFEEFILGIINNSIQLSTMPAEKLSFIDNELPLTFNNIDSEISYWSGMIPGIKIDEITRQKFKYRNILMETACSPYLEEDYTLTVEGISHCYGKDSIIAMALANGDKVERIFETPNLNLIENNISHAAFNAIVAMAFISTIFSLTESQFRNEKYIASVVLALATEVAGGYIPQANLLNNIILMLNLAVILITPSWTRLLTVTCGPGLLAHQVRDHFKLRKAFLDNSGPDFLIPELQRRSRDLYQGSEPKIKNTMLHQYNRARTDEFDFVSIEAYQATRQQVLRRPST